VRCANRCRTQHGFIASPVLANLDGSADGKLDVIQAGMDRHVYAWHANGDAVPGFPVLVVDRDQITAIDPQTHVPTFKDGIGEALNQGAIIDTPAVGDITGDDKAELVVGTNEEYDEPINAGNLTTATFPALSGSGVLSPANSRLYVLKPEGDTDNNPMPDDAILPGWPFKVGIVNAELLPVVGEGITGYPIASPLTCPSGGEGPKIGVMSNNGPAYVLNPNGSSCYGNDPTSGKANALETDFSASATQYDHPVIPAVGSPAFGDLGGTQPSFLAPAAGLKRALDVALPDYQGGQDVLGAWDTSTGQFRPNYPEAVNDLQFLTGPSIGDVDGSPGEETVEGTASMDLSAFNGLGASPAGWPKLTTDWTVANPLIGSFGTLDTDSSARKVVVNFTRSGYINVYDTEAPACSPSSWPRFHHDNANSGDYSRDAVLPGKPFDPSSTQTQISWSAPGDDLLCGTADHYEIVTSSQPIDEQNFDQVAPLSGEPQPSDPGTTQTYDPPQEAQRYVAVRTVDEQGNVGRVLDFDLGG